MTFSAKQNAIAPAISPSSRKPVLRTTAVQLDAMAMAVLLAVTAIVYFFGFSPLLERHALVNRQQQELGSVREKLSESQRILADLHQQSIVAAQQLEASPLRLQPVSSLNQRLALVSDLAMQGGAALDDLQPGKSSAGSRYDALPIHVAGTGSFPAFTALLHRIRAEFPDTGIRTFELSGNPQEEAAKAKFSVELLWYTEPLNRPMNHGGKNAAPDGDKPGEGMTGDGAKGSAK